MFAALTVARFREAASAANVFDTKAWVSGDEVSPAQLPLAKGVEKVCASMHLVLDRTKNDMTRELKQPAEADKVVTSGKEEHLRITKAAEVKIVKYQNLLRDAEVLFKAEEILT